MRRVVETKYVDYTAAVVRHLADSKDRIRTIGALGPDSRTFGDDSPYGDVWEEFKAQMQGQESIFFDAYEETIRRFCEDVIANLSQAERLLLWLESEAYWYWDDEEELDDAQVEEGVAEELFQRVCSRAADEPLISDETSDPVVDDGDGE